MTSIKPRWTGLLLMILLGGALAAILYSIYTLHYQTKTLNETVNIIAESKPDHQLIETTLQNLYKLENEFRQYINLKEQTYLDTYRESLNNLERQVSSIGDSMARYDAELSADEPSSAALISLKQELGDDFIKIQKKLDSLIIAIAEMKPLEKPSPVEYIPRMNSGAVMRNIKNDTIFLSDSTQRRNFIGRMTDAMNKDKDGKPENFVVLTDGSLEYFIVQNTTDKILSAANIHYNRSMQRIIQQRDAARDLEKALLNTNADLISNIQSLLGRARSIETLMADYKANEGIAELRTGTDQVNKMNLLNGGLILFVIIIMAWFLQRNLTYEKQLLKTKEQAIAIADERTNFLASMSHEIRTPLNSIVGFTDLLGRTPLDNEQKEMLDAAKISAKVLMSMVNDILDIGKLESGQFRLRNNTFRLKEVIEYVVYTIDLQAKTKNLPINVVFNADNDLKLVGDDLLLRQILLNLLSNAVKFTHSGYIEVVTQVKRERAGYRVMIDVKDTGAGISEDKMEHLFQKYYSSDTEKQVGGTGLGLYICKLMTQIQSGEITCTSKFGQGSTFSISIPYEAPTTIEKKVNKSANGIGHQPIKNTPAKKSFIQDKHFLVVDDNPLNIKLMNLLIKKWGATMQGANDGLEALELLNNNEFSLVLTDLMMPNMDGFELAEKIKERMDEFGHLPIIALTADILIENTSDPKYKRFDTVVTKPINEEELFFKLVAILSQSEMVKSQKRID